MLIKRTQVHYVLIPFVEKVTFFKFECSLYTVELVQLFYSTVKSKVQVDKWFSGFEISN